MIQSMTSNDLFFDSIYDSVWNPLGEGQASSKRFAGSQHVRHFQKHFESGTQRDPSFAHLCTDGDDSMKRHEKGSMARH